MFPLEEYLEIKSSIEGGFLHLDSFVEAYSYMREFKEKRHGACG